MMEKKEMVKRMAEYAKKNIYYDRIMIKFKKLFKPNPLTSFVEKATKP